MILGRTTSHLASLLLPVCLLTLSVVCGRSFAGTAQGRSSSRAAAEGKALADLPRLQGLKGDYSFRAFGDRVVFGDNQARARVMLPIRGRAHQAPAVFQTVLDRNETLRKNLGIALTPPTEIFEGRLLVMVFQGGAVAYETASEQVWWAYHTLRTLPAGFDTSPALVSPPVTDRSARLTAAETDALASALAQVQSKHGVAIGLAILQAPDQTAAKPEAASLWASWVKLGLLPGESGLLAVAADGNLVWHRAPSLDARLSLDQVRSAWTATTGGGASPERLLKFVGGIEARVAGAAKPGAPQPDPPSPAKPGPVVPVGPRSPRAALALPPAAAAPERYSASLPKDPLDEKQWPTGDVLWAPARTPLPPVSKDRLPVRLPTQALEWSRLPPVAYDAAVTAAREAMRLMQGPMSAEQTRRFEAKWAPYYDYPSQEIVAYLNQLNPLLVRFLEARAGFTVACEGFARALTLAGGAATADDGSAATLAVDSARQHKVWMDGYQARMAEAAAAIEALGPMPNPFALRARHRKQFEDEVDAFQKLLPVPAVARPVGYYYVLEKVQARPKPEQPSNSGVKIVFTPGDGYVRGSVTYADKGVVRSYEGEASWGPMPRVVKEKDTGGILWTEVPAGASIAWKNPPESLNASNLDDYRAKVMVYGPGGQRLTIPGEQSEVEARAGTRKSVSGKILVARDVAHRPTFGDAWPAGTVRVEIEARVPGGEVEFHYQYRRMQLTAEQMADLKAREAEDQRAHVAEKQTARSGAQVREAEARAKIEAIAFQQEMAAYFQKQRAWAEGLAASGDARARAAQLYYDANFHAAADNQRYLETGEWTRTRTLYDDYNFQRMAQQSEERARELNEPQAILNAVERQLALLPSELRSRTWSEWTTRVNTNVIASRDVAAMRKAMGVVAEQVRSSLSAQGARQEEIAAANNVVTRTLEGTQIVAGIAVLGVGGAAMTGAGAAGVSLWAGETLLGAAYGGATGYVEGGPLEASRRSLEWAGVTGFVASQAIEGWAESGTAQGAALRGAGALLLAKSFEFAVKGVLGAGARALSENADDAARTAASLSGDVADDAARAARFQADMEAGEQLIRSAEKAEWELAEALTRGGSQETVEQLTLQAERAAAAVNASWHAKFRLKLMGKSIAGASFDARIGKVYDKTMAPFLKELEEQGYDVANLRFRPLRNPSSAGSVSMDLDLALVETPGLVIRKGGQPVSRGRFMAEAQQAWNKAYQGVSGQSAEQSLLNITTLAHKEAYTLKLLQRNPLLGALTPAEIEQATQALRVKVSDIPLTGLAKFVENARGMAKEMQTKFLPYLRDQIARADLRGDKLRAAALRKSETYWTEVSTLFGEIGKHPNSPERLVELERKMRLMTGGNSVWDVADRLGTFWEALGRLKPATTASPKLAPKAR